MLQCFTKVAKQTKIQSCLQSYYTHGSLYAAEPWFAFNEHSHSFFSRTDPLTFSVGIFENALAVKQIA